MRSITDLIWEAINLHLLHTFVLLNFYLKLHEHILKIQMRKPDLSYRTKPHISQGAFETTAGILSRQEVPDASDVLN